MKRAALLACCPVLLAIEMYRRGYAGIVWFGGRQWCRATWRTEPDPIG